MNIEHLREFIELSRQLNFTSTARTLKMTQPALSNHIRMLESETGVLLMERGPNGRARLTPAGQCFLGMAEKIVSTYTATLPELKELQKSIEGKIVIRSPRYEYSTPLLGYVHGFQKEHPRIDIALCPWEDIDGIEDVANGLVDFAYVGYGDFNDVELVGRDDIKLVPYTNVEANLWLDRSHDLADKNELKVEDLNGYALLIPANMKHNSWKFCLSSFIKHFHLSCTISERYCDSLEDFVMNKVSPDDLFLCDTRLLCFPPFQIRDDRIMKAFSPRFVAPVSLGYRADDTNPCVQLFVDFLFRKYEESSADKTEAAV